MGEKTKISLKMFAGWNSFKGFLVFVVFFGLSNRHFLGSYENGIKLQHGQRRKVTLGRVFAGLYDGNHADIV